MPAYGHCYFRFRNEVTYWLIAAGDVTEAGQLDPRVMGTGEDEMEACRNALGRFNVSQAEKSAIQEEFRRLRQQ